MCFLAINKVSFFTTKILPLFLRGTLPYKFYRYITPTLRFYLEIAKLGHLHHLNVKDVNDILSNKRCYYKEVFDMFNYIMLVMYAIEQERDKEQKRKHGTKTQEQIAREQIGDLRLLLGDDSPVTAKDQGMITIEVTPEDMKKAKKEKTEREKAIKERRLGINTSDRPKQQSKGLPPGGKVRPSGK